MNYRQRELMVVKASNKESEFPYDSRIEKCGIKMKKKCKVELLHMD